MPAITHYDQGDTWTPQASFTVGGVATDPTTITVRVKEPDGTVTVIGPVSGATGGSGIVRESVGVYNTVISLDDAGYWYVRFEGTGSAVAAEDHEAIVDPSPFYESAQVGDRALVSLGEAKDWLQIHHIDTSSDLELTRVINDISDRLHEEAGREFKVFGTNPQTRLFDADPVARTVWVGDLASYTAVLILDRDGATVETVAAGDITSLPRNRPPWEPIRRLRFTADITSLRPDYTVSVAGTWGFPAVPGNIRQACLDAVAATLDRDVEHYRQDLSPGPTEGAAVVLAEKPIFLSLPAPVLAVAWGYRDYMVA